ncbi:glycosyltransferase family 4 protein [Sphingomicrobium marinum]|uniref:glycosyltransferase family 4 protein n=1 Tax=Sphingomicrobium marinum TaxID=1227950 RepID=UPI00223EBA06|nr:glycosyltransferase family 4 protein [Sphingomicrobium marinum]
MHILYLHQHFTTPKGITGTRSYENAKALVARGHKVTMACGSIGHGSTGLSGPFEKGKREGDVEGIHVIEYDLGYSNNDSFLKRSWTFVKYALATTRLAMQRRFDLNFATTTPLTAGIPVILARLLAGKRYVFEVRDLWPELPRAMGVIKNPLVLWALGVLEFLSYRLADRCVALSPGIADGIAERGVPRDKIAVIPNGCDLELFDVPAADTLPEGLDEARLVAIFPGTHGTANGLDAVLDAAGELKKRGRDDIAFLLVGDGREKPRLLDRRGSEGLNNVTFLPPMPKVDLVPIIRRADIGLQILSDVPAFYYGTSPNKFFDFIAAEKPVLNNYPGWLAGMIEEQDCGFAVPPNDPVAFADALEKAADDMAALKAMGERAGALAREKFNRGDLANQWVDWVTRGQ